MVKTIARVFRRSGKWLENRAPTSIARCGIPVAENLFVSGDAAAERRTRLAPDIVEAFSIGRQPAEMSWRG